MSTSNRAANGLPGRQRFRRFHRWVGVGILVFVLYLALTGVALNHSVDLGLDRRYVSWTWVLDAYGIEAPAPSASFADGGKRVSLLGERLFLDGRDTGRTATALAGMVALEPLILVGAGHVAHVLTTDGDYVEGMDLRSQLPGAIERVGRTAAGAIIESAGQYFVVDADMTSLGPWDGAADAIAWSVASPPSADELADLQAAWRGRGITLERLLQDLHSGRIFAGAGQILLDLVAILMIVLSLTGLLMSRRRNGRNR